MDFFQWSDELSVGNRLIDQDHQELIALVNELHSAAEARSGADVLERTLQRLFVYTQEHFQREEFLMAHINFPDFEAHRKQHQELIDQVALLRDAFKRGQLDVATSTSKVLRYWLVHHIMRSDRMLAVAARESGLKDI